MIVLVMDTAGIDCSVALYDSATDVLLADCTERVGKAHAERLAGMIEEVMTSAGMTLGAVNRLGVTIGPGSFTGIRTGVATARGLALALRIPAVGVSTLHVLAADWQQAHPGKPVIAAMDAKRGEIYAQAFDAKGNPASEAVALDLAAATAFAAHLGYPITGSAASMLAEPSVPGEADAFAPHVLARLAAAVVPAEKPKPLYLRAPDAKPQAGFALTRT